MGIKGLTKLISDNASHAIRESELSAYNGRRVAIDASMAIYQFLVAVRSSSGGSGAAVQLTNAEGEVTSHLQGMFYRTIRMLECGMKPVYVFDGKPPDLKSGELKKRAATKADAESKEKEAREAGTTEEVDRYSKRTVRMSTQHKEDCKELLQLMGVPVVEAPCEAEAQCAALAREGKVWAVASEDMDALTFRTPILLRRLTFSEARKMPVLQIHYDKAIEGLGLTYDQFVDMCILCGCDYTPTVRGIGPKKAYNGIKAHHTAEKYLASLDKKKFPVPEELTANLDRARELFKNPDVAPASTFDLTFNDPKEESLLEFLVGKHGFSADRVKSGITKLKKARRAGTQRRMDSFFTMQPGSGAAKKKPTKRAASGAAKGPSAKRRPGK